MPKKQPVQETAPLPPQDRCDFVFVAYTNQKMAYKEGNHADYENRLQCQLAKGHGGGHRC